MIEYEVFVKGKTEGRLLYIMAWDSLDAWEEAEKAMKDDERLQYIKVSERVPA